MGHANAAVRSWMSGQHAFMQCHPRPGDALHVGHWRAAVDVGMIISVLLDHAEDTHRRGTGTPVDTGPCATRTPLLNRVTFCVLIDTTSCSGPFGISPTPASFLGSDFSRLTVVARCLRTGTFTPPMNQPPVG